MSVMSGMSDLAPYDYPKSPVSLSVNYLKKPETRKPYR